MQIAVWVERRCCVCVAAPQRATSTYRQSPEQLRYSSTAYFFTGSPFTAECVSLYPLNAATAMSSPYVPGCLSKR